MCVYIYIYKRIHIHIYIYIYIHTSPGGLGRRKPKEFTRLRQRPEAFLECGSQPAASALQAGSLHFPQAGRKPACGKTFYWLFL